MLKPIYLLLAAVFITGCSQSGDFKSKTKGSYIQVGQSIGHVSEYKNTDKIDATEVKMKLNYGYLHGVYDYEKLESSGAAEGALHNREWQWLGVGFHTNKGTDFTFLKDLKDTKNNFWKVSIIHTNKIRSRLSTLYGLYHYDAEGGDLINSGGWRTSGLYGGLMFDVNKYVSILGDVTVGNNGSAYVQDVAKIHLRIDNW